MVRAVWGAACLVLAFAAASASAVEVLAADLYRLSGRVVHLDGVVAFQVQQGCPGRRGRSGPLFACGEAAMAHAVERLVDASLVCRATGGPSEARWMPVERAPEEARASLGRVVRSLPVRCSSHRVPDLSVALVAAGFAVPLDGARLEIRDAYRAAKRARAGVWGRVEGAALVHPLQWIRARVDRIRSQARTLD